MGVAYGGCGKSTNAIAENGIILKQRLIQAIVRSRNPAGRAQPRGLAALAATALDPTVSSPLDGGMAADGSSLFRLLKTALPLMTAPVKEQPTREPRTESL